MKMNRPITFTEATSRYVHRFTLDHTPNWANAQLPNGNYPAPQYASDEEWYDSTIFPGEGHLHRNRHHCESSNQTWPMGKELPYRYRKPAPRDLSAISTR